MTSSQAMPNPNRTKLPHRLAPIGFGVALVSLLAAGVSSYTMTRRLTATSRLVTHTHQVLEQLTTLLSTMQDVETGARGYVITGDQTFLEPYNRARIEAPRQLDALRQLTADNQNQQARVGRLQLLIGQKTEQVDTYVSLRREQGFEGARRVIASGQGKRIMDELRVVVTEMSVEETELLRQRQAATDRVTAISELASVIEGVLALGLLAAVFTALRHESRERSEAEQLVRAANAGLEQRVHEATAELRESEARLRSTLDTMIEGCQIIGFDWRYRYVNPSAAAHGRQPVAQLTGRTMMEAYPGIENTKVFEVIAKCMRDRVPQKMENEFVFPDGSTAWFELSIEPVREGVFILSVDVTERKRLEAQLLRAQKMEAMGRLAGGVAHDFNNLLSAMFVEVDLGLTDVPPDHPVAETLQQVRRAAEQAAGLSRQLLTFSRRQVVEPTVFSLNELVGESERMLRRLIGEDVELRTRLAPDLGSVRADRGQIEQVLVNLVVNARDAMPEGGKLAIETASIVLDSAYVEQQPEAATGPHVVLTVTDTGTGMTEEVRSRIFEPFFTTKDHGKGTGLGLSTSYGIVKQAGGHIGVYSEPGLGTTFRVYLPRAEATGAALPRRTPVATLRGTETILLVEDSPLLRPATTRILTTHGYRVLEAADGNEALELLAGSTEPVHLLLSDVVLPGLRGHEVARRVRAVRPDVRVLLMSGYTDDLITHQRLTDEGVAFLQKPYTQESLTRRVREVLDAAPGVPA